MQRTVHDEKRDISGNPHRGENIGQNNILRHPPLYWVTQKPINLTEVSDQQRASIPPHHLVSLSLSLSPSVDGALVQFLDETRSPS